MNAFDDFLNQVLDGAVNIAKGSLKDFVNEAKDDSQQFIEASRDKLKEWTTELANDDIDKEQFDFLVRSQAALAEMHALTQAGIAAAQVQKFRDALINLVIDTAFKVFIPTL